jgi:hypothetical protein
MNKLLSLAEKFLNLVKAEHNYDPSCLCPDCVETELRIKNEIKKEKSSVKRQKSKHR